MISVVFGYALAAIGAVMAVAAFVFERRDADRAAAADERERTIASEGDDDAYAGGPDEQPCLGCAP